MTQTRRAALAAAQSPWGVRRQRGRARDRGWLRGLRLQDRGDPSQPRTTRTGAHGRLRGGRACRTELGGSPPAGAGRAPRPMLERRSATGPTRRSGRSVRPTASTVGDRASACGWASNGSRGCSGLWNPDRPSRAPAESLQHRPRGGRARGAYWDWIPASWVGVVLCGAGQLARALGAAAPHPGRRAPHRRRASALPGEAESSAPAAASLGSTWARPRGTRLGLCRASRCTGALRTTLSGPRRSSVPRSATRTPSRNTAISVEYFHNGEGFSDAGMDAYLTALRLTFGRVVTRPQNPGSTTPTPVRPSGTIPIPIGPERGHGHAQHHPPRRLVAQRHPGKMEPGASGRASASPTGGVAPLPASATRPRDSVTVELDAVSLLGPRA